MNIFLLSIFVIAIFLTAYLGYGFVLKKIFKLGEKSTPATLINDGKDFVPASPPLLLGQHFSAIAAAGPIVGPILAGLWFGWLPAILWIILGAIFIGGVHDFTSLIASVRHNARSIGEIVKEYITPTAYILFLLFIWFTIIYVIIAFTDITAQTFRTQLSDQATGPAIAVTSFLYLLIGVVMGISLYKFHVPLSIATIIFLPLVILSIWIGQRMPQNILDYLLEISAKQWGGILLIYCFIASIIPVWVLLQPRGYLGGWFLYSIMFICLIGVIFGGYSINYPAFRIEGLKSIVTAKPLFPILFITVACGACSGFHALVSSGTTSKQLRKENDALPIAYGGMLLEGIVAIFALVTLMILKPTDEVLTKEPSQIYATGIATFTTLFKINFNIALGFALLAFSTFVYDTLDVCTRLGRYVFQELIGWHTRWGAIFATLMTLIIPTIFLFTAKERAYLVAWPIFGTSNQLLASLTLLAITVWLIKTKRNYLITLIPMLFMLFMTLWSLILLIKPGFELIIKDIFPSGDIRIVTIGACILLILSIALILETIKILFIKKNE